jgi:type IV secretion system protein VirB6
MSTACAALNAASADGLAPALRAVDCMTSEATAAGFARLFGLSGVLGPVLTLALTLYIAFFALGLLTGRGGLRLGSLSRRALTLGLVLSFATSWAAYNQVVWNLAIGAPDQIAAAVTGARGKATERFATRIDALFAALSEAAEAASQQAAEKATQTPAPAPAATTHAEGSFAPASVMWLSGALLLLGTAGVLIASRIVMAVLLTTGPVFIVLALFRGTRGLCAGWLRALLVAAMAPVLAVVGGSMTLDLTEATIQRLDGPEGINPHAAYALFLIAAVHVVLMMLALRAAGHLAGGWTAFAPAPSSPRAAPEASMPVSHSPPAYAIPIAAPSGQPLGGATGADGRSAAYSPAGLLRLPSAPLSPSSAQPTSAAPGLPRAQGIGSRFRNPPRTRNLNRKVV